MNRHCAQEGGHRRSADQMEQRGKYLAAIHNLTQERPQDRLMKRLAENEAVLMSMSVDGLQPQ
ncbi:MAG: hypothetical protein KIT59_04495 [Nitrosomonas sp.]|nr:hypothetical protein [Nitrosomonas sp.]